MNEAGPNVTGLEIGALKRKFRGLVGMRKFRCGVLSGSIPPGVPSSIYAELIQWAREADIPCALDTSGEALIEGLQARPWMVKPNIHELSSINGRDLVTTAEVVEAAQAIRGTGVEYVLVTCGSEGAFSISKTGVFQAIPPKVKFVSGVGSGDAFLSAYLWTKDQGSEDRECLKAAAAAGAANAEVYGSGFIEKKEVSRLAEEVQTQILDEHGEISGDVYNRIP